MNNPLDAPVGEVMTTQIEMVAEDVPIRYAATLLLDKRIAGLPVTSKDERLIGVVSWSDIMRSARTVSPGAGLGGDVIDGFYLCGHVNIIDGVTPPLDLLTGTVRDCMNARVIAVSVEATVAEAARVMTREAVHRVLVVDSNDNLAGIVSASDIVRQVAECGANTA
jgi:CBS domain-containing membrane protein